MAMKEMGVGRDLSGECREAISLSGTAHCGDLVVETDTDSSTGQPFSEVVLQASSSSLAGLQERRSTGEHSFDSRQTSPNISASTLDSSPCVPVSKGIDCCLTGTTSSGYFW
ncbi:predicted protein [Aspergillus nidulans FGSC A4]|uniref:Uncharacterized protein n=1 Tax=Emericella nidulans (strain FGSC A4 / ATCC 38163 / CBS 112.46 / NRRL 194 / M139) TaxID=227321 RepID=Q5BA41_EMENI|nr:hypothetical protein [Aspergillus nidulans FGSC A4]EAA64694.1 predicted protein [Aspergillus nidulans FGSC A4]CBF87156.1 TPA: conserved hypothetical protein [Aspergillus nidulans FGSC A4]|eukprot:XP_660193.1 predicted protein [Aspergillus nidulans FGSC A4]